VRFFIDHRDRIAAYVLDRCPEQAAEAMAVADDVVTQRFLFNLRWDMERTYEPVAFEGPIDWLHQPGDDPEWIYAFNRMRFWICLGQAYAMTGDEKYALSFASQLESWIDTVKREDPRCAPAWRSIEAGLRMEYWCKAMAYFDGSPSVSARVREKFSASVAEHAEFIMGVWNSYNLMSNWGVLANHGLFVASVYLAEVPRAAAWREEALRRLALEMEMQVYGDGTQWEQSPMYHNEVAHDFLDVVILARRNDISLPPIIEEKTHAMVRANLALVKPNGFELSMGDSDDIDARDILSKGAYLWRDGTLKAAGYEDLDFDCVWDLGFLALEEYDTIPRTPGLGLPASLYRVAPPPLGSNASGPANADQESRWQLLTLQDSGNFSIRSSWEKDATFLHFHSGTLGAGHGHADQLHFDLFAKGEDILVDSGRYTYVAGVDRYEFKGPTAHNTCTLDSKDFYVCQDSWACSRLDRAVNRSFSVKGPYALLEGGHLGYYGDGVFVNRRIVALSPELFVVADEFYAKGHHSYESYLHFSETGSLSLDGELTRFVSPANDVVISQLSAFSTLSRRLVPSRISRHYNLAAPNPCLVCSLEATGFASLFTVIALDGESKATLVPVRSNFKNIHFETRLIEALSITHRGRAFTLALAHQEYASPTDTFLADGCTGFGQVVVFDRGAGEREIGTVLQW